VGGRVQRQIPDPQHRRTLGGAAADQRPHASQQLAERERLDEIVVGTHVQPLDPVGDRVARRQHQHWRPATARPQAAADLEAVDARQHHVEDDRVVVVLGGQVQPLVTVEGNVDRVALLLHPAPDRPGHLDLVLHDQHSQWLAPPFQARIALPG